MRRPSKAVVPIALLGALLLFVFSRSESRDPVAGPVVGFERGDFSEVTDHQQSKFGRLSLTGSRAYEGKRSARATYLGGGPGKERVWLATNWKTGTDVWYGIALLIPKGTRYCYWNPLRWDNYDLYGGVDDNTPQDGDVGGVTIEQDRVKVMRNFYGGKEKTLIDGGAAPKGRWFWLELHQRFSGRDGEALSELYVDGHKKGSSTQANSAGRPIKDLRAGAVNIAGGCSSPGSVDFDRVSISDGQRGPA